MVPVERIELPTFGLQNRCTTAVLHRHPHIEWHKLILRASHALADLIPTGLRLDNNCPPVGQSSHMLLECVLVEAKHCRHIRLCSRECLELHFHINFNPQDPFPEGNRRPQNFFDLLQYCSSMNDSWGSVRFVGRAFWLRPKPPLMLFNIHRLWCSGSLALRSLLSCSCLWMDSKKAFFSRSILFLPNLLFQLNPQHVDGFSSFFASYSHSFLQEYSIIMRFLDISISHSFSKLSPSACLNTVVGLKNWPISVELYHSQG